MAGSTEACVQLSAGWVEGGIVFTPPLPSPPIVIRCFRQRSHRAAAPLSFYILCIKGLVQQEREEGSPRRWVPFQCSKAVRRRPRAPNNPVRYRFGIVS